MLTNIILAGLIPGIIAGPIHARRNQVIARGGNGKDGYEVDPPLPTAVSPVSAAAETSWWTPAPTSTHPYGSSDVLPASQTWPASSPSFPPVVAASISPSSSNSWISTASSALAATGYSSPSPDPESSYRVKTHSYSSSSDPTSTSSWHPSHSVQPAVAAASSPPIFSSSAIAATAAASSEWASPSTWAEPAADPWVEEEPAPAPAHHHIPATNEVASAPVECNGSRAASGNSKEKGPGDAALANAAAKTGKKPHHEEEEKIEGVTYEQCVSSCKGRFQHVDIAFDVSQGDKDCAAACVKYKEFKAESVEVEGRAEGPASVRSEPRPATPIVRKRQIEQVEPITVAVDSSESSFVTYESCLRDCASKWQTAGIAGGLSQGRKSCKEGCTRYAQESEGGKSAIEIVEGIEQIKKRQLIDSFVPAVAPTVAAATPAVADVEVDTYSSKFAAYESCVRDCSSRWQSVGIAGGLSQGRKHCQEKCERAAEASEGETSEISVVKSVKRHAPPVPAGGYYRPDDKKKPHQEEEFALPFPGHDDIDLVAYNACVESCKGKHQSADIAFDVSTGEFDCSSGCERYIVFSTKSTKRATPTKREIRAMKKEAKAMKKRVPQKNSTPVAATPSTGKPSSPSDADFEAYDLCLSGCKGKHQSADIAFDVSTGEFDCESKCEHYIKIDTFGFA